MASSSGSKSTGSKLGFKLTVDGEREYKQTCDNIKQSLKVLGSELKLASAEFAGNADSVDALRTKQEILTRQYGEHQKAVEENEKMLARLRAEENQNTDAIAKFEIALNNSKTELVKTGNQLEATEEQLNGTASEANNFGKEVKESTEEVEKSGGSLSKFGEIIGSVGKAFAAGMAAIGGAAVAAGKNLFDMATGATEAGDRVDKMSQKLGMSAEGFQEWDYILGQNGASIDSLGAGMKTLTKTLDGLTEDGDKASEAFKAVGIDFDDIKNKSPEEAFNMTIAALQEMPNGAEKTAAALKLLGKQGMELAPLINSTAEATEDLRQNSHKLGLVMSDETVSAAATFGDSMDDLKAGIGGFKNMIGAEFLPGLTTFTQGLTGILTGDEGAGALMKEGAEALVQNIADVIPKILGVISNMASVISEVAPGIIGALVSGIVDNLPGLTETAGTILSTVVNSIVDALPLLIEGAMQLILTLGNGIIDALPYFAPKVVEILTFLVKTIADNLPMIATSALSLITGLADGLISSIDVLLDAVPEIITSLIDSLLNMIPEIINAGVNLFTSLIGALPEIINKIVSIIPLVIDGILAAVITAFPLLIDAGISLFTSLVEALPEIITSIVSVIPQIINSLIAAVIESLPLMINAGIELLVAIIGALPEIITAIVGAIPQIIDGIITALVGNVDKIIQAGIDLFIALVENLPVIIVEIVKAVPKIVTGIVDSFKGLAGTIKEIGSNILAGIWEGITGAGDWLKEKISGFFGGVVNGIKNFLGIHSPSTVFAEMGGYMAEGVGVGFGDEMKDISNDMGNALSNASDTSAQAAVTALVDGISGNINKFDSAVVLIAERIASKFGDMKNSLINVGADVARTISSGISDSISAVQSAVTAMVTGISETVSSGLDSLIAAVRGKNDEILSVFRDYGDKWYEAGQSLVGRFEDGIDFTKVIDKVSTAVDEINKTIGGGGSDAGNQYMTMDGQLGAVENGFFYPGGKEAWQADAARRQDFYKSTLTVNINQPVSSPAETARALQNTLKDAAEALN